MKRFIRSADIPDISNFEISIEDTVDVDNIGGLALQGTSYDNDDSFSADIFFGYERQVSHAPRDVEFEPDVLYIQDVYATPGKAEELGAATMRLVLEEGYKQGFRLARMGLVDLTELAIVEDLRKLGIIKECFYKTLEGPEIHPQVSTKDFMKLGNLNNRGEAAAYLMEKTSRVAALEREGKDSEPAMGHVDCVIKF